MGDSFSKYCEYLDHLSRLATGGFSSTSSSHKAAFDAALDGGAFAELTRLVPRGARREAGSFFTDSNLAARLAKRVRITSGLVATDPTVGAGDLLLAVARRLPIGRTVDETLERWAKRFAGVDRIAEFVEATKLRLWLLAHVRHRTNARAVPPSGWLPNVVEGSVFDYPAMIGRSHELLLNPPFVLQQAPDWYDHAHGKVNAAAVIVRFVIDHMRQGSKLHVVLPEVLRTGSLYQNWRTNLATKTLISKVESCGLFPNADVDVFIATFERTRASSQVRVIKNWSTPKASNLSISQKFDVSVGAVVDYRDPRKGKTYAFLHPKSAPLWKTILRISDRRAFSGTVVRPPFVVVRRTSRPGDKWRASASIVGGNRHVAVENHLIVCRPKSNSIADCERLLKQLQTERVNYFLNKAMRCRHLTVGVVKSIPLCEDENET